MANNLYNQLMQNQSSVSNAMQMINSLRQAKNPEQLLLNLANNNSAVANILNEVRENGGDAQALFYKKTKQLGIDPNTILNQLK